MDTRYQDEAAFHNQAYADNVRQVTKKYYVATVASSQHYRQYLEANCRGKRVLEYGCGENSYAIFMTKRDATVSAIDISDVAIKDCKERARKEGVDGIDFRVMNAEKLEYSDNTFDLVCGAAIIHHLEVDPALREIARVLKPSGSAIFREPLGYNPLFNLYRRLTPKLRTKDEHPLLMQDLALLNRHFEKVEITYYHLFTLLAVPVAKLPGGGAFLKAMNACDRWLFRYVAPMRRYAWTIIIEISQPKRTA